MLATPTFAPPHDAVAGCPLCHEAGGVPVWSEPDWRVIRVDDAAFPAYYRVIRHSHVAELSMLSAAQRQRCMDLVAAVDAVLLRDLQPTKVNLAALGNIVPHLHWHVVARFDWDSHFPQPIWGPKQRDVVPPPAARLRMPLSELDAHVAAACAAA
ncbi:MAG TPA: HIT family protein [Albitalea sp.]|nr:HIT family protein [Albitalea sp.]